MHDVVLLAPIASICENEILRLNKSLFETLTRIHVYLHLRSKVVENKTQQLLFDATNCGFILGCCYFLNEKAEAVHPVRSIHL